MSITSLALGALCLLCTFDEGTWDKDETSGFLIALSIGMAFGVISLSQKKSGRGMATGGVVLSAIALLIFVGSL